MVSLARKFPRCPQKIRRIGGARTRPREAKEADGELWMAAEERDADEMSKAGKPASRPHER